MRARYQHSSAELKFVYILLANCYDHYWKTMITGVAAMYIDKDLSIGQRFKKIRLEKGISQERLAEGICSNSVVSHIETDRQYPSAHIWGKLAERLGVPVYEIMGEQEKQLEASFQLDMIRVYIQKGEYAHALKLVDDLGARFDLLEHQRVELIVSRAECFIRNRKYSEAIELLIPFVEKQEVQQTISDETLCEVYNKIGSARYWHYDFEKAYSAFEQGYRISLKLPEFGLISARVTKNLGLTCNQLGFKDDARLYLEKAYAFFNKVSDLKELANTLFDMSLATGNPEYILKARSIYEGMNYVREANLATQHYAFHVESKNNYKKAIEKLITTAIEFEKIGDLGMCVYTYSRGAKVCLEHQEIEEAESLLWQAKERMQQLPSDNHYYTSYYFRINAELKLILGMYEECVSDAEMASNMYAIMGMYADSGDAMEICTKAYESQQNITKAYESSKKVIDLLRKLHRRNEK
jgi:transcriptional regulator with XRE-family HTH domain